MLGYFLSAMNRDCCLCVLCQLILLLFFFDRRKAISHTCNFSSLSGTTIKRQITSNLIANNHSLHIQSFRNLKLNAQSIRINFFAVSINVSDCRIEPREKKKHLARWYITSKKSILARLLWRPITNKTNGTQLIEHVITQPAVLSFSEFPFCGMTALTKD